MMDMRLASARRRGLWICLGAGAYALHLALGRNSAAVENSYSRGVFVALRWVWDHTLGFSPVPLLYVYLGAALLWGAGLIAQSRAKSRGHVPKGHVPRHVPGTLGEPRKVRSSAWARVARALLAIAGWAGALVFFFYVLWGFNYNRVGVEKQLHLEVMPLDLAALKAEAEGTARALVETRASIPEATKAALDDGLLPRSIENAIRPSLSKVLEEGGFPVSGRARVRPLWPGGLLMRMSSSGFYLPYCGEGYIAGNLTAPEEPFVTAHEMVHVYGIADEGAANFLGYLACESSGDPIIRYSGLLSYWNYVFAELAGASRDEAVRIAGRLPEGVKADIRAVRENWDKYRGPLRATAQAVYERYLKSQGVKEGMRSYDRFVSLVVAWKRR
jgi:hypothetical protein